MIMDEDDKDLLSQRTDEFGVMPDDGYAKRTLPQKKNKLWNTTDIPYQIIHTNIGGLSKGKSVMRNKAAISKKLVQTATNTSMMTRLP